MAILLTAFVVIALWRSSAENSAAKSTSAVTKISGRSLPIHNKLKGMARKAASAEWFMHQRTYPVGYIPKDAEIKAVDDMRQRMIPELQAKGIRLVKSAAGQLNWESLGPGNIGGRLRGLVTHPNNPNIVYVGSVAGGVWKSTNGGATWAPTMNDLITLNISALTMKPSDPNTLYAGTGEAYFTGDCLPGRGILKTTDGGQNWKRLHVAQGLNSPFITEIAVSPADPNVVYASGRKAVPNNISIPAETVPDPGVSAIFKSTDSGETWQDVTTGKGIEHDPQTAFDDFATDVVVSP
ncbi:MAG: WD40/YVTN/BNR-like repeat-containing protein, partial [bacterium]